MHRPEAGEIRVDGACAAFESPRDAERAGLRFIHQELSLVPSFDAVGNIFMGRPHPARFGLVDRRTMRRAVATALEAFAPDLPLDRPVRTLTIGQRQMVEIARALLARSRLIVMDEPTAALGASEAQRLHTLVRALAEAGTAILYVSHRLADVLALSSTVTVLRNGATAFDGPTAGLDQDALVALMSGQRRQAAPTTVRTTSSRPIVLHAERLRLRPSTRSFDLSVRRGEILGLYGLVGAGRSRLLKTLWGARRASAGSTSVDGRRLRPGSIRDAMAAGMAFVPEDRRTEGLLLRRSVADNLGLPHLAQFRLFTHLPWPSRRQLGRFATEIGRRLSVRFAGPEQPVGLLSGGNQQKILLGRWLPVRRAVLLLDEPTRGVDVGAKADLYGALRVLAADGTAILVATSDLEEAIGLCDRIALVRDGSVMEIIGAADATPEVILGRLFAAASGGRLG